MAHSGAVHKILSVLLRLGQFAFAVIVLGILSRFCYLISIVEVYADGRIVYAMVVSGIAIVYSIFFCIPVDALFCGFPFDIVLFIMWLIAFCLLVTVYSPYLSCYARGYMLMRRETDRKRVVIPALRHGIMTTGVTIGADSGALGQLEASLLTGWDVLNGESSWPSHLSLRWPIF
jgi:hypothetical protein